MWKKLGTAHKGNQSTARSHSPHKEGSFKAFYAAPKSLAGSESPKKIAKSNFCQDFVSRHSLVKPFSLKRSKSQSETSIITLNIDGKRPAQANGTDLFSIMRLQANFKKTSSKEHANAPIDHNASLLEEQLKVYKAKWHSTQLKLKNLQSKQTELKSYLTAELKKWKEAIKATSLSIQSSFAKREEAVRSAREQVKQYRDKENKWNKQREDILRKHNLKLENLI